MSTRSRAAEVRAAEAVTSDHRPECPACHDFSHAFAQKCESCGAALTPAQAARARGRRTQIQGDGGRFLPTVKSERFRSVA